MVDNQEELVENVAATLPEFDQPLLVEEYLDGRELNVALLGNGPTIEVFDPVEIDFYNTGHRFQSFAGKKNGRYKYFCPADISASLAQKVQSMAVRTFNLLKCSDYARIDFRLDKESQPFVLEINSMAAIHSKGSYFFAARTCGYDYQSLLNRMIEIALARY